MSKAAHKPRQATPPRSWFWLQGAIAGVAAAVMPGVALLIGVLLCPAIMVYASEKADGHPVGRAMLLCGSTAVFQPLRSLWNHEGSLATALDLLADPTCPLLAWVACGAGWLLCESAQVAGRFASQSKTRRRIGSLEQEQAELAAEWTEGQQG